MRHLASLSLFIAAAFGLPAEALAQPDNRHSLGRPGRDGALQFLSSGERGTAPPWRGRRELFCYRQLAVNHRPFPEGVPSVQSQGHAEPDRRSNRIPMHSSTISSALSANKFRTECGGAAPPDAILSFLSSPPPVGGRACPRAATRGSPAEALAKAGGGYLSTMGSSFVFLLSAWPFCTLLFAIFLYCFSFFVFPPLALLPPRQFAR